jgi:hypothetical protein
VSLSDNPRCNSTDEARTKPPDVMSVGLEERAMAEQFIVSPMIRQLLIGTAAMAAGFVLSSILVVAIAQRLGAWIRRKA